MRALAMTFDDGPDPVVTPRLLDLLASEAAQVTFFPIADRAAAHPGLIRRMLAEGHAVGVHCNAHERHVDRDAAWGRRDADRSLDVLSTLGVRPRWWRTPWGEHAEWTAQVASERDLQLIGWDVDTHDWRGDTAEQMWSATRHQLTPGAVILAHDGIGPGALRDHARETVAYTRRLIGHAGALGLALRSL